MLLPHSFSSFAPALLPKLWVNLFAAFILSFLVINFQAQDYSPQMRTGDSYIYLSTAKDLVDTNIMTNGVFRNDTRPEGAQGQGNFFTPLYPFFLSLVMRVDKNFYDNTACHVQSKNAKDAAENCGNDYRPLIYIQTIILALNGALIWLGAYFLTRHHGVAWGTIFLGLLSGIYGQYATEIMTEAVLFPLFTMASFLLALGWKSTKNLPSKSWLIWGGAGLAFGLVTLTRPAYAYLIYAGIFFLFFALLWVQKMGARKALLSCLFLILGFYLAVGPWIIRNGIAIGDYKISSGYGAHTIIQRLSYNQMSWQEWRASFIYHLPDFGDSAAAKLYPPSAYERFKYENRDGFYYQGNKIFRAQIIEEAGGQDQALGYALKNYLIPNLGKHTAVTFSMIFNGIWIGKYWAFVTLPLFLVAFFMAIRRKWFELIVLSFPGFFMLGFHAFTSVNVTRYNMPMVPSLSLAAVWVIYILYLNMKQRRKA